MGPGGDKDWNRAHAVAKLATTRPAPDVLLTALRDLRSISDDKKQRTLDQIAKTFALASIETPTAAECREAIGIADNASWSSMEFFKHEPSSTTVTELVDFMLDVLGCAHEPRMGAPAPPIDQTGRIAFPAATPEDHRSTEGCVETQSCTIVTKRDSTFYPGDVNSPPYENVYIMVEGKRRDGTSRIGVSFHTDRTQMSLHVGGSAAVRDRIRAQFFRAFC